MRNLYLYSLILIAFIAIGSLYWTIILGISKQVFYSVTLTNTVLRPITEKVAVVTYSNSKNENEDPKRQVDWISLLSFDLSTCPLAANPFPLFRPSK
jgi:hypothetical protein